MKRTPLGRRFQIGPNSPKMPISVNFMRIDSYVRKNATIAGISIATVLEAEYFKLGREINLELHSDNQWLCDSDELTGQLTSRKTWLQYKLVSIY